MAALIDADYLRSLPLGIPADILGTNGQGRGPIVAPATLDEMIDTASTKVEQYCRRIFAARAITEERSGKNTGRLMLRHYPIVSLDEVTWTTQYGMSGTEDLSLIRLNKDKGWIEFRNPYIGTNQTFYADRLYEVTYTPGYSPVPGPVKMATAIWTMVLLEPLLAPGGRGKNSDLIPNSMETIIDLLEDYRREAGLGD